VDRRVARPESLLPRRLTWSTCLLSGSRRVVSRPARGRSQPWKIELDHDARNALVVPGPGTPRSEAPAAGSCPARRLRFQPRHASASSSPKPVVVDGEREPSWYQPPPRPQTGCDGRRAGTRRASPRPPGWAEVTVRLSTRPEPALTRRADLASAESHRYDCALPATTSWPGEGCLAAGRHRDRRRNEPGQLDATARGYADAQVGKLIEHIATLGLGGSTVLIVTSDHDSQRWPSSAEGSSRSLAHD
jgi:hypothetical protein